LGFGEWTGLSSRGFGEEAKGVGKIVDGIIGEETSFTRGLRKKRADLSR